MKKIHLISPDINLDYLISLTDNTGLLQHSKFSTALKREGYTTDDNSRALSVCLFYDKLYHGSKTKKLIDTYLSFLLYMQTENGQMHNFLGYNREFLDEPTDEECIGRTILACGHCLNSNINLNKKAIAKEIFDKALPWTSYFKSPRAIAQVIMGLSCYKKNHQEDKNLDIRIRELTSRLIDLFNAQKSENWTWFEPYLTYANGRLSQSLFSAYSSIGKSSYLKTAIDTLNFLIKVQFIDGIFVPIGNKGWYRRGKKRAIFDQQPIEASCMVEATATAFEITGKDEYKEMAYRIFQWFLGKNIKGLMLYDPETGGCYDGLSSNGLNMNQGAEAILSYLTARLRLESIEHNNKL